MKSVLLLAVVLCMWQTCHTQQDTVTDCSTLRVGGTGQPKDGTDLPVCGDVGSSQCCTSSFITDTAQQVAQQALRKSLREQLEEREEEYEEIVEALTEYLSVDFLNDMANSFPLVDRLDTDAITAIFSELSDRLRSNFVINSTSNGFSTDELVDDLIERLISQAASLLSNTEEQRMCVMGVIREGVSENSRGVVARSIQVVRQSLSSLIRISQFLQGYRSDLPNFSPVSGCIDRLVELSFCGRCTSRIPPLCSNTCNALVRGCLSPYYSALFNDFRQLWRTSAVIITRLNTTIAELFDEESEIIDVTTTYVRLVQQCQVSSPFSKRQVRTTTHDSLRSTFSNLISQLSQLDGAFEYDSEGLEFCRPESSERDHCSVPGDGGEERDCDSDEVCTSACQCWDGETTRDTNTPNFNGGNGVDQQVNNPTLDQRVVDELISKARELGVNTPANAFLTSELFSTVVPEGVEIPSAEPFNGGAEKMIASLVIVMVGALVGLAMM